MLDQIKKAAKNKDRKHFLKWLEKIGVLRDYCEHNMIADQCPKCLENKQTGEKDGASR